MNIKSIKLQNYRNLKQQEITPESGINIICGNNAQGKTNLLEAIWITAGGQSFRGSKDGDLINFQEKSAQSTVTFFARGRDQKIKTAIAGGKREVFLNGVLKTPVSSIVGTFTCVVFSPAHLSLIKDGPHARRHFIDTALCQLKPPYAKILIKYRHILRQRNSLLRAIKANAKLVETLDIWDEKLASCGAILRKERELYLQMLHKEAQNIHEEISSKKEQLKLSYQQNREEDEKTQLLTELKNNRPEDLNKKFTGKGPHRDDIDIKVNQKSARLFGSQGQQRSAALALKIAEAKLLEQTTGEKPVILLDDVMSELDQVRQDYILNFMEGRQVFITCCENIKANRILNSKAFIAKKGVMLDS